MTPNNPTAYSRQAYQILKFGFTVAPIAAGLDKYTNFLTNWTQYVAPFAGNIIAPSLLMHIVGIVEVAAGILVAVKPRIGAYVVSLWLVLIIINLLLIPGFYDIALRDLGLALGALALGRLSEEFAV
jgi:uncharacterized membrane protein YphA (DoxX/SURF4 family)